MKKNTFFSYLIFFSVNVSNQFFYEKSFYELKKKVSYFRVKFRPSIVDKNINQKLKTKFIVKELYFGEKSSKNVEFFFFHILEGSIKLFFFIFLKDQLNFCFHLLEGSIKHVEFIFNFSTHSIVNLSLIRKFLKKLLH